MNHIYPMSMKLTGKKVAIIGGGRIALRKAKTFADTGAKITVISPKILKELQNLPYVAWKCKEFEADDIKDAQLIFAATNVRLVNEFVCQSAHEFQWVNDTSASENSSFMTPAIIRRDKFILTVSTSGASPVLAKKIKQELEEQYDSQIVETLDIYESRRRKK